MPTLLEVLTRRNLEVNRFHLKSGGNTTMNTNISPQSWYPWPEFNYANLTKVFSRQLRSRYVGPERLEQPLPQDQVLFHEDTLEDFLRRFIVPAVNYCLDQSEGQPHFGRGSRCGGNEDWSVVSPIWFSPPGDFANRLPGDTKQKVVAQVLTYMADNNSRYGFIITDEVLVVLRLTYKRTGQGIAADRPRRQVATPTTGHQRQVSDISMASGNTSGQESSFQDDNPLDWEYYDPEYVDIPWSAHGKRLTVKLALWCLAMMATNGDNYIDYSYPTLDGWLGREEEAGDNIAYVSEGVAGINVVGESGPISSLAGSVPGDKGKQRASDKSDHDDNDSNDNSSDDNDSDDDDNNNRDRDDGKDGNNDGDGDNNQTEVGASQKHVQTTIKRHRYSKRLRYQDYKGN
ncbi:hypothetical protein F5B22DRAFT_632727 [Xylaria bambusicola]|uniref:uncharacterized protein n=1 Tax=Xylaria bambusicola TaxID=326684 RepID=UPI002008A3EE|nr:uncharacterized protein F5B22DRAFT_632727 [Xylaria bambusicola]KAI0526161.1 hypothetical protein F5B22DRAFT_632727 [Xylaria bambusicola]